MEIKDFKELTTFVYDEFQKMSDAYGLVNPSTGFIRFSEKTLERYMKLYDKPLYKKARYEIKRLSRQVRQDYIFNKALETMPHGKVWKFFHPKLWDKIQDFLSKQNKNKKVITALAKPNPLPVAFPQVLKPVSPPQVSSLSKEEQPDDS